MAEAGASVADVSAERALRLEIWEQLQAQGIEGVEPARIRELGIYGGAQGIWVDKARTGELTPDGAGIAVGVLHTGRSYADDLTQDSLLYHYPRTRRPAARDGGEVNALKWAGRLNVPVFAILPSPMRAQMRSVRLSWVEDSDDDGRVFLLSLADSPTGAPAPEAESDPFFLTATAAEKRAFRKVRQGQPQFHMKVIHRYGAKCAVCDLDVPELIEAAHLCAVSDAGSNDARNGLPLCVLHHRAFDRQFWAIDPSNLQLICRGQGPGAEQLRISRRSIDHLRQLPHRAALAHAWKEFKGP